MITAPILSYATLLTPLWLASCAMIEEKADCYAARRQDGKAIICCPVGVANYGREWRCAELFKVPEA